MLWLIGVLTAVLTAFYSFRLLFLVFGGKERFHSEGHGHAVHPHESPLTMTIPLLVLSIATVFAGWAGEHYGILQYLSQELPLPHTGEGAGGFSENALKGLSVAGGLLGILMAWALYGKESAIPGALAKNFSFFYKVSLHKWYFDELYDAVFVRPSFAIGRLFWQELDKGVIDGIVNGVATFFRSSGGGLRRLQSGQIQNYAMAMAIGAFGLVAFYLFFNRL
jgi:NADH-quinone oxidoreductase subunit L